MNRTGWAIVVVVVLCAVGFVQAKPDSVPPGRVVAGTVDVGNLPLDSDGNLLVAGGAITNHVLDLLDAEVVLRNGERWESEIFDTSAFNRVVLRFSDPSRGLLCGMSWQIDDEDFWFVPGEGGVIAITSFEVLGTRAKVTCLFGGPSFADIQDVKVLLRRE